MAIEKKSYISVKNSKYYIRVAPNKEAEPVGIAVKGDELTYLGDSENGWWYVQFGDGAGWVSQRCGTMIDPEPDKIKTLRIKKIFTNMRTGPASTFGTLKILWHGSVVDYLDEEMDGWLHVRYKDKEGWVKIKAVEEVDE